MSVCVYDSGGADGSILLRLGKELQLVILSTEFADRESQTTVPEAHGERHAFSRADLLLDPTSTKTKIFDRKIAVLAMLNKNGVRLAA